MHFSEFDRVGDPQLKSRDERVTISSPLSMDMAKKGAVDLTSSSAKKKEDQLRLFAKQLFERHVSKA